MQSKPLPQDSSKPASGFAIALLSAAILSTTAVLIRYLINTYHMPALVLAFWRAFFVAVTLSLVLFVIKRPLLRIQRKDLGYLVIYGLVLSLFNSFWTISVAQNGAAIATVLAYSSAAFTALLGWWILHEELTLVKVIAVLLSLGGCVLISEALNPAAWSANPVGILTGLISGLCYAIYSMLGRAASQRGLNPWTSLLYTFGFGTVFLFIINLAPAELVPGAARSLSEYGWLGNAWAGWAVLLLLAAGPTIIGYGLYNVSLSMLPSSVANLIVTTEPVFTTTMAYFFLGEMLSGIQIAGSIMILTGVLFLRLIRVRK